MQGLGNVLMKGKLEKRLSCQCCVSFNFKKTDLYNDKQSHKKEADAYFNGNNRYYPPLEKLFDGHKLVIEMEHPVGEDVVYVDDKFSGYVGDWLEFIDVAMKNNIKFNNPDELKDRVFEILFQ